MVEDICDRRGCDAAPTVRIVKESVILSEEPTNFDVCDHHATVAAEEFRESGANVLASKKIGGDA